MKLGDTDASLRANEPPSPSAEPLRRCLQRYRVVRSPLFPGIGVRSGVVQAHVAAVCGTYGIRRFANNARQRSRFFCVVDQSSGRRTCRNQELSVSTMSSQRLPRKTLRSFMAIVAAISGQKFWPEMARAARTADAQAIGVSSQGLGAVAGSHGP